MQHERQMVRCGWLLASQVKHTLAFTLPSVYLSYNTGELSRGCKTKLGRKCVGEKGFVFSRILNTAVSGFHSPDPLLPLYDSDVKMTARQRAPCAVLTSVSSRSQAAALQRKCDLPEGVQKQKYDFSNALTRSWGSHCYIPSSRGEKRDSRWRAPLLSDLTLGLSNTLLQGDSDLWKQ